MKIINAMFGRGLGGIEQAFVDYADALKNEGHSVLNLVRPAAKITDDLWQVTQRIQQVRILGWWDFPAIFNLRKIVRDFKPDAIIAHGNRAYTLLNKANRGRWPLIGVVHNYKYRKMLKADALFSITEHLRKSLIEAGFPQNKIYKIPNMINLEGAKFSFNGWQGRKPIIGSVGRFVRKKGFDDFIMALAILKNKGIEFSGVIGGGGEEEENLKSLAQKLGLTNDIKFTGWVEDKEAFFKGLDIFCLPSLHEPFGIVLLEAMKFCKPIVTSDSEGPSEIIKHEENGLIFQRGSPENMAAVLEKLVYGLRLAEWITEGGYKTVRLEYDAKIVGEKISAALNALKNNG